MKKNLIKFLLFVKYALMIIGMVWVSVMLISLVSLIVMGEVL